MLNTPIPVSETIFKAAFEDVTTLKNGFDTDQIQTSDSRGQINWGKIILNLAALGMTLYLINKYYESRSISQIKIKHN